MRFGRCSKGLRRVRRSRTGEAVFALALVSSQIEGPVTTFRIKAPMDCVVVMSACPQDIVPIDALNPVEVGFVVTG
jgi:hypothetical protein